MSRAIYYVPWEGYAKGSQPEHRGDLDRLCLQGPHTLERAMELAGEIRQAGMLASVIECKSLEKAELAGALIEAAQALDLTCKFDPLNPCTLSRVNGQHWGGGPACAHCKITDLIKEARK